MARVAGAVERGGVGGERICVGRRGARNEHVHAERRVRGRAQLLDLLAHLRGSEVAAREEPEAARVSDRPGQVDRRRPAGHRGLDDRVPDAFEDHLL